MTAQAYDMSRFWRILEVQHGRVSGSFIVHADKSGPHNVKPHEVAVFHDDEHTSGRSLCSRDLTAFVVDGEIRLPKHMIRSEVRAVVEGAWDDVIAAIEACVTAFPSGQEGNDD